MKINIPKIKVLSSDNHKKSLYKWEKDINLKENKGKICIHDGPPFPNGPIHHGHVFNKLLKDVFVRFFVKEGFKVNYFIGWDSHGAPVENKVKEKYNRITYNLCKELSSFYLEKQLNSFNQLQIYTTDTYYNTDFNNYQSMVLKNFFKLVDYKRIKYSLIPVLTEYDGTPVAFSETEYIDTEIKSIKYAFMSNFKSAKLLIWTTTPWSIKYNEFLAFNPHTKYVAYKFQGDLIITSIDVMPDNINEGSYEEVDISKLKYQNINLEGEKEWQENRIFPSDKVNPKEGTGILHSAPLLGLEDMEIANHFNVKVKKKNIDDIFKDVLEKEMIYSEKLIVSSQPYSTRSKNRLFYTPSYQVYIQFKEEEIQDMIKMAYKVNWMQDSLRNRFIETLSNRPRIWCLSRKKEWGIPIIANIDKETDTLYFNHSDQENFIKSVIENGSYKTISEPNINIGELSEHKFDVWFESGSSFSMFEEPVDLIVEGTDQHRGWFQVGLIISYLLNKTVMPPYKNVITHGFVTYKNKKLSKSDIKEEDDTDASNPNIYRAALYNSSFIKGDCELIIDGTYSKIERILLFLDKYANENIENIKLNNNDYLDEIITIKVSSKINEINNYMYKWDLINAFKLFKELLFIDINSYIFSIKNTLYCHNKSDRYNNAIYTIKILFEKILSIVFFFFPSLYSCLRDSLKTDYKEFKLEIIEKIEKQFGLLIDIEKKAHSINNSMQLEVILNTTQLSDKILETIRKILRVSKISVDASKEELISLKKYDDNTTKQCSRCWFYFKSNAFTFCKTLNEDICKECFNSLQK